MPRLRSMEERNVVGSIRIRREKARRGFQGRDHYYAKGPASEERQTFCKVLEHGSPLLFQEGLAAGEPWKRFPWLTLIIGSGCLDARVDPISLSAGVKAAIAVILDGEDEKKRAAVVRPDSHVSEAETALDFVEALVSDRAHPRRSTSEAIPAVEAGEVSPIAARFVLLAGVLTRLFYSAKASSVEPVGRWEGEEATLSSGGTTRPRTEFEEQLDEQAQQTLRLSQWHCMRAIAELPDAPREFARALGNPLEELLDGLKDLPARIDRSRLRLITEVCWYLLTMHQSPYPGWTELLLGLTLREGRSGSRTRPAPYDLRDQATPIEALLLPRTEESWRRGPADDEGKQLMPAAADVLWAQANEIRRQLRPKEEGGNGSTDLPPASAFVTGFDLELEMALWRSAPEGSSFFVVLPVHVFHDAFDEEARPCWLRGEVRKEGGEPEGLQQLRFPVAWQVLTPKVDNQELLRGPHIVHLNGAPLIGLPGSRGDRRRDQAIENDLAAIREGLAAVKADPGDGFVNVENAPKVLEHAVTTDEYLAVRQAEVELILASRQEKDSAARGDRSLPPFLSSSSASDSDGENPRFWMALGVPISDPAVRHRLVSQLTPKSRVSASEAERPAWLPTPHPPRRFSGIVVNLRISDEDAHLLYWMGFDVVRDSAAAFTTDLRHYAKHIRRGGNAAWPPMAGNCPIAETEAHGE